MSKKHPTPSDFEGDITPDQASSGPPREHLSDVSADTGAAAPGSQAPTIDQPTGDGGANPIVNPSGAPGTDASRGIATPPLTDIRASAQENGVKYTGGVDLTLTQIAAQKAAVLQGSVWKLDLDQIQAKDFPDGTDMASLRPKLDGNKTYPSRDAAILAFIGAVRSGSTPAQSIDSSTNQPDSTSQKAS